MIGPALGLENFHQKSQSFNFFLYRSKNSHRVGSKITRLKDGLAPYLLRARRMLGSGPISTTPSGWGAKGRGLK